MQSKSLKLLSVRAWFLTTTRYIIAIILAVTLNIFVQHPAISLTRRISESPVHAFYFVLTEHELARDHQLKEYQRNLSAKLKLYWLREHGQQGSVSRKEVTENRESFRRSRGDWSDQTAEANLVLFLNGFRRPLHPDRPFLFRRIKTWILPRG